MISLLSWLQSKDTPRWALMLGAISLLALTTLTNYYVDEHVRKNEARSEKVQLFIDSMNQFQVFASAFSTELFSDGKVSTPTRVRLIENINTQITTMRNIEDVTNSLDADFIIEYRNSLLKMRATIDGTTEVSNMKDFWSAASRLTVARNRLTTGLRNFL